MDTEMVTRKKYSKEFKLDAVSLVTEQEVILLASKDVGVS